MATSIRVRGRYENGNIILNEPAPELDGMRLDLEIAFPDGHGQVADISAMAVYPGPVLELGSALSEMATPEAGGLLPLIRDFRQRVLRATGLQIPPVRILVRKELMREQYAVRLDGLKVGSGSVRMDRKLVVVNDPEERRKLEVFGGDTILEPIFGMPGQWILERMLYVAKDMGLTVVTPLGVVAGHLEEVLARHLPLCLGREVVEKLVVSLRESSPALLAAVIPARIDLVGFHQLLRDLLAAKRQIAALPFVLEAIEAFPGDEKESLAEFVARQLLPFEEI